ncbi:MAG: HAMP domain-containing sensor histidine kinase, partial [Kofleriaceae bacterium]
MHVTSDLVDTSGERDDNATTHRLHRVARGTSEQLGLDPRDATITGIVHDLKTPLATIALEVELLGATIGRAPEVGRALDRIGHNARYMDRLLRDLLDAASIADGCLALQLHPTELRSLITDVVDRVVASRDRERVIVNMPESVLVLLDALRIERVLANLLTNALKYSPHATSVHVTLERREGRARVSVEDSGVGLTADEMTFVFDKYRRAPSAARHDGVGLGLFVSRKIVEEHLG